MVVFTDKTTKVTGTASTIKLNWLQVIAKCLHLAGDNVLKEVRVSVDGMEFIHYRKDIHDVSQTS